MKRLCLFIQYTFFLILHLAAQESDSVRMLGDIVVSVNRWEENLREVPNRVSQINAPTIRFQNPQTAADLLGFTNQVFIQKSQLGGGSPMIRGFATNRVLLVIDGVRMNNAIFRSGNVQNVISLDPHIIESAEVIFGPGSVIYGSDAIGGVMDFHSRSVSLSLEKKPIVKGHALLRYASANNENTGHVDFMVSNSKIGWLSSISHSDFDDLIQGSRGPTEYLRPDYIVRGVTGDSVVINDNPRRQRPSGYSQINSTQKLRYQPIQGVDIQYAWHYSRTSRYDRYDRLLLRNPSDQLVSAEWYYGPQKWEMHNLQLSYSRRTALSDGVRLIAAYQDYQESRHTRNRNSNNRNNRFERVKAWSLNLDVNKKISDEAEIFYGAELVTNKVNSTAYRFNIVSEAITPISTRYPDNSDWRSAAAYLNLKLRLSPAWLLTTGMRFTYVYTYTPFDTTFFDFPFTEATLRNRQVNNSVGLIYSPDERWKVYGNFSTGFRAPNVDDIGKVFDSQPGSVLVPNPNLRPELAYNTELGFAAQLSRSLTVDAGVYYTWLDNALARGPYTFNGQDTIDYDGTPSRVLALQNISKLYVYGFQAGITWKIIPELSLISHINLQNGREENPEAGVSARPTHVAPHFGTTQLVFQKSRIMLNLYSQYNASISASNLPLSEQADRHLYALDANGNLYAPSWWTLNLKGSYTFGRYFTVNAGVENILDKRYRPYSSGISAPGRNFILAIRASI
jgi:hemoglobin/transferrin/lactoferrin receptor protein